MGKYNFKEMSNNEISIEMKNLENKYESIKLKVASLINEMKTLDDEYISAKEELNNRNKGIFHVLKYWSKSFT